MKFVLLNVYCDISPYIEGILSSVTLSPTLVDPACLSVIRAVDGQDTGLSAQLAEKEEPTSDRHRPGFSSSERTGPGFSAFKASANRPAQRMQPLTSSSTRSWLCDSPTRSRTNHVIHQPRRSELHSSELTSTVIPVLVPEIHLQSALV